jgi:hypothetical protein
MDEATADTVTIDCTAFKRLEGTWITTKATEIVVVKDRATAGRLRIDADVAIFRNYFRPAGFSTEWLLYLSGQKRLTGAPDCCIDRTGWQLPLLQCSRFVSA